MIDLNGAVQFVLRQEDAHMTGVTTNAANDHGGRTRWGVAENAHPELTATGFFDTMSTSASLETAINVYIKSYAAPLMLTELTNQCVAQAALSFAINEGPHVAAKVLQGAVNYWRAGTKPKMAEITVDGSVGNQTITAVNQVPVDSMLTCLFMVQMDHYNAIIAADPSQAKWQNGWRNRALASTKGQIGQC